MKRKLDRRRWETPIDRSGRHLARMIVPLVGLLATTSLTGCQGRVQQDFHNYEETEARIDWALPAYFQEQDRLILDQDLLDIELHPEAFQTAGPLPSGVVLSKSFEFSKMRTAEVRALSCSMHLLELLAKTQAEPYRKQLKGSLEEYRRELGESRSGLDQGAPPNLTSALSQLQTAVSALETQMDTRKRDEAEAAVALAIGNTLKTLGSAWESSSKVRLPEVNDSGTLVASHWEAFFQSNGKQMDHDERATTLRRIGSVRYRLALLTRDMPKEIAISANALGNAAIALQKSRTAFNREQVESALSRYSSLSIQLEEMVRQARSIG